MKTDYTPKPAYNEMQLLTKSLRGETFTKQLNDGYTSDWLLVFSSPSGQQTLAAWTTRSGGRTVTVPGWGTHHLTSTPFYVNPSTVPESGHARGAWREVDRRVSIRLAETETD